MTRAARLAIPLALLLSACAGDTGPDAGCEAQVNRDPAVADLIMKGAGSESFKWQHEDDLRQARQRARIMCLQGRGVLRNGGGVEAPRAR